MTKLADETIQTNDPRLKEILSNIITLWNNGQYGFNSTSTVPSDTPSDYEVRMFSSGATRRIYVYFPGDQWRYVALT